MTGIPSAEENSRLRYLDFFKATAMILVIFGHISFANSGIKAWIYSFHMPAFFFASGLLLKPDRELTPGEAVRFIWKRFQSLMLPFFLWAVIYAELSFPNLAKIAYGSHLTLNSAGAFTSSLWFLPALFLALVFYALARMILKEKFRLPVRLALMVLSFVVSAYLPKLSRGWPWCFDVAFCAFGFLLLGNTVFPAVGAFCRRCSKGKSGVLLCVLLLILSLGGTFTYVLNLPNVSTYVLMAEAKYGNYPLFLLTAVSGVIFVMAVAILLDLLLPVGGRCARVISYIGTNTMLFFALQKPLIKLFKKFFEIVTVPDAVALIVTFVGTTALCCLLAAPFNRYLPIAAGKIPKKVVAQR